MDIMNQKQQWNGIALQSAALSENRAAQNHIKGKDRFKGFFSGYPPNGYSSRFRIFDNDTKYGLTELNRLQHGICGQRRKFVLTT
jgi:hypothetical protein